MVTALAHLMYFGIGFGPLLWLLSHATINSDSEVRWDNAIAGWLVLGWGISFWTAWILDCSRRRSDAQHRVEMEGLQRKLWDLEGDNGSLREALGYGPRVVEDED